MNAVAHRSLRRRGVAYFQYLASGLRAARCLLVVCLLAPLAGCGDGLADVSGTVTLDGQPLRGGSGVRVTVFFQPVSGSSSGAVGIVDGNGRYQLSTGAKEGVVPGEYVVTCSATKIIPSKVPGGAASGRRLTDPKYANAKTSGLQFTIESGDNEFNIPLESGPSQARR
jgi:hypothetical protein